MGDLYKIRRNTVSLICDVLSPSTSAGTAISSTTYNNSDQNVNNGSDGCIGRIGKQLKFTGPVHVAPRPSGQSSNRSRPAPIDVDAPVVTTDCCARLSPLFSPRQSLLESPATATVTNMPPPPPVPVSSLTRRGDRDKFSNHKDGAIYIDTDAANGKKAIDTESAPEDSMIGPLTIIRRVKTPTAS